MPAVPAGAVEPEGQRLHLPSAASANVPAGHGLHRSGATSRPAIPAGQEQWNEPSEFTHPTVPHGDGSVAHSSTSTQLPSWSL